MSTSSNSDSEQNVVIAGVGLIGGSIAAATRSRCPACRIIGVGRSDARLQAAKDAGLLDDFTTQISQKSIPQNSLIVICYPVDHIAEAVIQFANAADSNSIITDAGSVKEHIYNRIEKLTEKPATQLPVPFVGAHPIAGSEQTGFEYAQPDLYDDRVCVITPESAPQQSVKRVTRFWQAIGCRTHSMSASEHDQILARTSHLPHLAAAATALCVTAEQLEFTGSGFRDTTRIAAGSSDLWTEIFLSNRDGLLNALRLMNGHLSKLATAIEQDDASAIRAQLDAAATLRRRLSGGG